MLVKRKAERDKSKYLSYSELRKYVRDNNILTKEEYIIHLSKNYLFDGKNIPYNPSTFYPKDVWEGWSIFLRDVVIKKNFNGTYYTYDECKVAIKKYKFASKNDFVKRIKCVIKEDVRIPYSPSTIYKEEWEGWIEFLDTDNIDTCKIEYVSFQEAREFARSLKFKIGKQWRYLSVDYLMNLSVPKKPDRVYRNKGWTDWYDFLGIDKKTKMSYGEIIISNFLVKNKINYIFDKSLKDCISSSKLRFDFYLPDYNICIEFDGKQHFEPLVIFGGEEEFKKTQIRDKIKNEWCEVNDINLIRFNYKQNESEIQNILNSLIHDN